MLECSQLLQNYLDVVLEEDTGPLVLSVLKNISLDHRLFEATLRSAKLVDHFIDLAEDIAEIWNSSMSLGLNAQDEVKNLEDELLAATSSTAIKAGGYHYVVNIVGSSIVGDRSLREPEDFVKGDGIYVDSTGNKYEDEICLQNECIVNTVEAVNREDASTMDKHMGGDDDGGIPSGGFSREELFGLLWVIPGIVAFVGLISMINCCPCKTKCKSWTKYPSCVHMCCITLVLPFIFLLAGGFLFPVTLLVTDSCRGVTNVGYQYVSGSAHHLCESSLGGTWEVAEPITSSVCKIELTGSEDVDIPILQLYQTVMGDCGAHGR